MTHNGSPTAVYRWYDANDQLLYVGVSFDLGGRFAAHKASGRGRWRDVVRIQIQWHDDRPSAYAAEAEAIATENPRWNANGPGRWPGSKVGPLVDWASEQVTTGAWAPGEEVPPAAAWAAAGNIGIVTARKALRILIERGILHGDLRRGVYVADRHTSTQSIDTLHS